MAPRASSATKPTLRTASPGSAVAVLALLEGPVPELGRYEQPGGEERGSAVQPRVVHRELGRIQASEQEERRRKQHRPAEHQRGNERQECENGYAEPGLDQGIFLGARERERRERGRAGDGSSAGG